VLFIGGSDYKGLVQDSFNKKPFIDIKWI